MFSRPLVILCWNYALHLQKQKYCTSVLYKWHQLQALLLFKWQPWRVVIKIIIHNSQVTISNGDNLPTGTRGKQFKTTKVYVQIITIHTYYTKPTGKCNLWESSRPKCYFIQKNPKKRININLIQGSFRKVLNWNFDTKKYREMLRCNTLIKSTLKH